MQEQQEVEKSKQQKLLAQRLANRRKDRLDQLANEQRDEIEAEEKKEEEEKKEDEEVKEGKITLEHLFTFEFAETAGRMVSSIDINV